MPSKRGSLGVAAFVASLAACVDGPDPTAVEVPTRVSLQASAVFAAAPATAELDPISRARVRAVHAGRDSVLSLSQRDVDPEADTWTFDVEIDLTRAAAIPVKLQIELASVDAAGVELVQWSGETPTIHVSWGLRLFVVREVHPVLVYRGPLDNLSALSVSLMQPRNLILGETETLDATIDGGGPEATVFFETLDPDIVAVHPLTGFVEPADTGTVRVVARAGPAADTAAFVVAAPPMFADPESIALLARAIDYYGSPDFVFGMQGGEDVQEVALTLRSLALDLSSGDAVASGRAFRAAIRTLQEYGLGSETVRQQDGPQLSLMDFSLLLVGDALGVPFR